MSNASQQRTGNTNIWLFALELGFFAGLIWGGLHWLAFWLSFTKVSPGLLAEPFFKHHFLTTAWGHAVGFLLFIVFSIFTAMLYVLFLRKLKGPVPGMIYGILWWAIIFIPGAQLFLLQPPFKLSWNTLISEICIYLLWGMFIGYTAAIEYTDERKREQTTALA